MLRWHRHNDSINPLYFCGGNEVTEGQFKKSVANELKERFLGCILLKNDPTFIQGIPDLLILWHERWAALEFKKSKDSPHRPNQDYYIDAMNKMAFAAFIYPENRQEVLNDLERTFKGNA